MDKVIIYQFRVYDIHDDQFKTSRRWGTREAIRDIACGEVIKDSGIEVDATAVASDIPSMANIGYNPKQSGGLQTQVDI